MKKYSLISVIFFATLPGCDNANFEQKKTLNERAESVYDSYEKVVIKSKQEQHMIELEDRAKNGDTRALVDLAHYYRTDSFKDYSKAIELLNKAAQSGNPYAYENLGEMIEKGHGVSASKSDAILFYKAAIEINPDLSYSKSRISELTN